MKTESRVAVPRSWREGDRERKSLFHGSRVFVGNDEKVLGIDIADGYTTL